MTIILLRVIAFPATETADEGKADRTVSHMGASANALRFTGSEDPACFGLRRYWVQINYAEEMIFFLLEGSSKCFSRPWFSFPPTAQPRVSRTETTRPFIPKTRRERRAGRRTELRSIIYFKPFAIV